MKVAVVGSEDMALGLGLAGADETYSPKNEYEAFKMIDKLVESSDVGIILLSERISKGIEDKLDRLTKDKGVYPVIVRIPDERGKLEGKEDPLKSKIRRAVGIDITSQEDGS